MNDDQHLALFEAEWRWLREEVAKFQERRRWMRSRAREALANELAGRTLQLQREFLQWFAAYKT